MADKVGFSCNMFVSRRFMLQVGGSSLGEKTSAVGKKKDVCYQSSKGKKIAQIANPICLVHVLLHVVAPRQKLFYFMGPSPAMLAICPLLAEDDSQAGLPDGSGPQLVGLDFLMT